MLTYVKDFWTKMKPTLIDLEYPILVFPVLVVMIVATTFLFPSGKSGAWQWWLAVALTIALCFYKVKGRRRRIATSVGFLLILAGIWIITKLTYGENSFDGISYHFPAIRMMTLGWNPLYDGTFDAIKQKFFIEPGWMGSWHILAMPKSVWYFCSAAYFFTKATFNLFSPLWLLLFISAIYYTLDFLKPLRLPWKLLAIILLIRYVPGISITVDGVVAMSALGLLCSMIKYIKERRVEAVRLIVFTFWMATAKQLALVHCCVFWSVFIIYCLIHKDWNCWRPVLRVAMPMILLFSVASISPYITSYVNFGHPFYPKYSSDKEKFPIRNITEDFLDRNADAAYMSHAGAYVYAFISSEVACAYYRFRTKNDDFCPKSHVWTQRVFSGEFYSEHPTTRAEKAAYCFLVLSLLIFCGPSGRFAASCIIAGTLTVPTEMIGYLRYTPWIYMTIIICIPTIYQFYTHFRPNRATCLSNWVIYTVLFMLVSPFSVAMKISYLIDHMTAIRKSLKHDPPQILIASRINNEPPSCIQDYSHPYARGNLVLLSRQETALASATCLLPNSEDLVGGPFYDYSFYVSPDYDLARFSEHYRILAQPDRKARLLSYPTFIIKTIFITLPKSILEVLRG